MTYFSSMVFFLRRHLGGQAGESSYLNNQFQTSLADIYGGNPNNITITNQKMLLQM